jgi:hypothetical protein
VLENNTSVNWASLGLRPDLYSEGLESFKDSKNDLFISEKDI